MSAGVWDCLCAGLIDISKMPLADVQQVVDRADMLYYRDALKSSLSDAQYDAIKAHLRSLNPSDERLVRIGSPYSADEIGTKVVHTIPMGSLDNTDDGILGFEPWFTSVSAKIADPDANIFMSLKIDGSSIRARYENGKLSVVATRGNGEVGEDVTANGSAFAGLPITLSEPITCDVRGEAVLPIADFKKMQEIEHDLPFDQIDKSLISNPRNVGNGIVGREDGTDSHLIQFIAFNIVSDREYVDEADKMRHLESLGFTPVQHWVGPASGVRDIYNTIVEARDTLKFEIDGLVVVLNDIKHQKKFITDDIKSQLRPKHSRAIKFPHKSNTTILEGVVLSVGHTGAIIPTARLKEVRVGGVNVTNCLLNNWDEIVRLGVAVGDEVEVVLAGDIIPKLTRVVKQSDNRVIIDEPHICPSCGSPTSRSIRGSAGAVTYCTTPKTCPAAMLGKIDHWIGTSKKGVGILDIGDAILQALSDNKLVCDPADLYTLTVDGFKDMKLDGGGRVGASRAKKIVANISNKKKLPLHIFLGSLGIELLGRRRVQILVKEANGQLDTLNDWLDDTKLASIALPGFGDAIRNAVRVGIDENRDLIAKLLSVGVSIDTPTVITQTESSESSDLPFSGMSFCFTGTREGEDDIERLGGTLKSGVSKGLTYLVQKDALSQSNKSKKAEEYGTIIISADYLKRAIVGEVILSNAAGPAVTVVKDSVKSEVKPASRPLTTSIDDLVSKLLD